MAQQSVAEVVKHQNRVRRVWFWIGFLAIFVVGVAWAGLIRDPIVNANNGFFAPGPVPMPQPIPPNMIEGPFPVPVEELPFPLVPTPAPPVLFEE